MTSFLNMLQQVFRLYNVESKHFALSVDFNLQSSFSSLFKSTLNILHLDLSDVFLLVPSNITFPELGTMRGRKRSL